MKEKQRQELTSFLQSCEIFKDLSYDEVVLLLPFTQAMEFKKGDWIIKEGDIGQNIYLIKTGQVEVVKKEGEYGYLQRLDELGPGEWVGEMAYFEEGKRSASIRALDKVEVVVLSFEGLRTSAVGELFYPKVVKHLAKRISQRLRKTGENLIVTLTEKLKLVKATSQISRAIIHLLILFALFINASKLVAANVEEFPILNILFPSLTALAFGLSSAWLIRSSDYSLNFYGLTLDRWGRHTIEAIVMSIPFIGLVTLIKFGLIYFVSDFRNLSLFESPFHGQKIEDYFFYIVLYLLLVPVQELVARSFLQSCFRNFFHGHHRSFLAILTSNLLFEMTHTMHHLTFAVSTFCFGFFWGYLFERQKSLVGVCVSHALIGSWVFFVLDYEDIFKVLG